VRLDFANGIRSMMRQDPDIILVGEIRDSDTAEMAFRAAMTGHQVFSTLHTNSALGAVPRLLDIGILPDIMAGNVIGVIAQRLVRKLCVHCKQPYQPSDLESRLFGVDSRAEAPPVYKATGCDKCDHQGYSGRLALMEMLKFDVQIDEMVARKATVREITQVASEQGFKPLADDGLRRILDGITSLDEVSRVINLTDRLHA
jgi:type II secretory ATPase GspE/PulE/Tfp pilus assembly ATPase PilB-like protein